VTISFLKDHLAPWSMDTTMHLVSELSSTQSQPEGLNQVQFVEIITIQRR